LHNRAQRANGIDGIRHDQLWDESELDSGHGSGELHDQHLHRIEERNFDRNRNRHIVCSHRTFRFDRVQLHG
jgi:hypothetical protein